jgi:hypothetical protein
MKQMLAPQAPVLRTAKLDSLTFGNFFRLEDGAGEVFFSRQPGSFVVFCPVMENGKVSRSQKFIDGQKNVCVLRSLDLGIFAVELTDEQPSG